ncbi:PREDICTED: F-box protein At1g49990-like [Camelina sativa]|uniref:F-box protein At1g49990-like n=1 Tax=Camelina sativa TaxID=90675 RepID=A0ABM1QGC4_CAMSA|nr:PREDICTED: F-box protein At1g49990-like [Camelina sativa]
MGRKTLPETMLVEVIARLPLKSIARFKSVCKTLKSVIESAYFRSLFVSLHRKYSLSSWSLMLDPEYSNSIIEVIGFTKCETWGLPKSIVSYIVPFRPCPNLSTKDCFWAGSSNGLIWLSLYRGYTEDMLGNCICFVGNPALQQWVEIPPYPDLTSYPYRPIGLVTRVENGVVPLPVHLLCS